jgi:hypothetical protein
MKIRPAIQAFLQSKVADSPFLIPVWTPELETQIMCVRGTSPGDRPGEWVEDGEKWSNIRWPHKAGSDPNFSDFGLTFDPYKRIEKIGSTWWNWQTRESVAVGIDIDVTDGHADTTTTVTGERLNHYISILSTLDYVTLVRSTGGKGLHIYCFLGDRPAANNHHEHADNARRVLAKIDSDLAEAISKHVDCVGSVLWLWSSSSPADHPGFSVIKQATRNLDAGEFKDFSVPVRERSGFAKVEWDSSKVTAAHNDLLQDLASSGYYFLWKQEVGICHTHTKAIERVFRERKAKGTPLRGSFETSSRGSDPMTPNCFITPLDDGAFRVTRFGHSHHEPSWEFVNGSNYTIINEPVCPLSLIRENSAGKKRGNYLLTADGVAEVAQRLGEPLASVPTKAEVLIGRDNSVKLVTKEQVPGWTVTTDGSEHTFNVENDHTLATRQILRKADAICRSVVTPSRDPIGWFLRTDKGWVPQKSYEGVAASIQSIFGEDAVMVKRLMSEHPWTLVFQPFAGEYPGDRNWNLYAPQLAVEPNVSGGDHPTVDNILTHIGQSLNKHIPQSPWCNENGIANGKEYLTAWIASVIQYPFEPLAYLFLTGPQESGKSILHEFITMCFAGGVANGGSAIESSSGYNAELASAVIVAIEEQDLSGRDSKAYQRIKHWVTATEIPIHKKYQTPYMQPNAMHFVQTANCPSHLPLEDGDSRVVILDVPALAKPIPKMILKEQLRREIPSFLRTLLNTHLGPPVNRLRVPVVTTDIREDLLERAANPVISSVRQLTIKCSGSIVKLSEVYPLYRAKVEADGGKIMNIRDFTRELRGRTDLFQIGNYEKEVCILNFKLKEDASPQRGGEFVLVGNEAKWDLK